MKIYTRTGDQGTTATSAGRVAKDSKIIEFLGELDELNALLGLVLASCEVQVLRNDLNPVLGEAQNNIFNIGSVVADTELVRVSSRNFVADLPTVVKKLEVTIDEFEAKLPELRNFILPGGTLEAANIHLARAVCRRVERTCVDYVKQANGDYADAMSVAQIYLNRLSDLLFVLSRYANHAQGEADTIWKSDY